MHGEFRQALERGDFKLLRKASAALWPHLPQPESDEQAEITMHHARTQAEFLPVRKRAYSHHWLTERDLPSGLPDELKSSAERMFPVVIKGVGISVNARSEHLQPAIPIVRGAMEEAVLEAAADGKMDDVEFIGRRMKEARDKAWKAVFGKAFDYG